MQKFSYQIKDPQGIHARPTSLVAKQAKQYACNILLQANGQEADLKKILPVLSLAIKQGQEIVVICDGQDEIQASQDLQKIIAHNW